MAIRERPCPNRPPILGSFYFGAGILLRKIKKAMGDKWFAEYVETMRNDPATVDPNNVFDHVDEILAEVERFTQGEDI